MSYFLTALQAEGLKICKSKVIWITAAAFTIAPLMAGFFMVVLKSPELLKSSGLLEAKAQFAGEANWPSYISLHAQIIAVGGILIFGFVTSWIFGREYADHTVKDLLALPYSRAVIVMAKFIAAFLTNTILSTYVVTLGFFIGWIIGLTQWSSTIVTHGLYILVVVTILTIALCTPVAFFASYGGGYLAPLGFVIFTLVLSQIVAIAGFGEYFPWAVPALYSGVTAGESALGWGSLLIIFITSLLGVLSTLYWWLLADQH
ncbi:bacitracin ABC transporter permease [Lentibacillus populi]|uniref:Bacitracin ABC transporter permease n=1 Tax=Lentibacillus populi TaxID=1827502 RepID=A0A9W5X549_9BACI|nr:MULTISPECIES: ABC transporter permease [Bacillaceae]MBT2214556.1 ABC transporter permease [Virgibacillus dakarensis]GGB40894.1 bacitracin ABC transporter permease [Lentibacillus populi]